MMLSSIIDELNLNNNFFSNSLKKSSTTIFEPFTELADFALQQKQKEKSVFDAIYK